MISIGFTMFGIVFNILLIIVYFGKERIELDENKFYNALIFITLFSAITEVFNYFLVQNGVTKDSMLYMISIKFLFLMFLLWLFTFVLYIILIGKKYSGKNSKTIFKIVPIMAIVSIIILLLPVDIESINGLLLPVGLGVNAIYVLAAISVLLIIGTMIKNRKYIKNKEYYPIYVMVFVFSIVVICQNLNPELLLINPVLIFITFLMYFTIENPDLKLLRQAETAQLHAEQANRAKSDFLSSMSHEIRTPLNAIVGFSEDIRDYIDSGDNERIKEDADLIVSSSETLLEIVGNIIDISKIESEKLDVVEKVYNPKEEIEKLTKATATRIGDKPIDFHLSIAPDIPYELIGDSGKVKQVINNLLTNSIKYTEQGEINLRIECINQDNISVLKITCQDTGRGIKKENIEKLFNKFERLDIERNTTTEGTGLGLAITKSIVEMMGGKINVQSRFGEGSIFIAQIPQKIQTLMSPVGNVEEISVPIKKAHIEEQPRIVNSESNKNIKKVLIVDDNKLNITVAKKVLDEIVDEVESVMSGQECLDKINAGEKYDVILMDIMMPEMSGETTFKKLQEISGFDIPVIALTADAESTSRAKYLSEGFNDYIAKPFKKDEIKSILDKYSSTDTAEENTKESIEPEIKTEPIKYDPNIDRFKDALRYEITGDGVKEVDKNDIETL